MIAVAVHGIDWDTSDWDCELVEGPHSANVPDLPEDVEEFYVDVDDGCSDWQVEDAICDSLSDQYGFTVNGFESWERVKEQ
jgi:hypothetical protein